MHLLLRKDRSNLVPDEQWTERVDIGLHAHCLEIV